MNLKIIVCLTLLLSACSGNHDQDAFSGAPEVPIVDSGGETWDKPSEDGSPSSAPTESNTIHNTKYCQVDDQGKITSTDSIVVTPGDRLHGIGGFCITRPIREVWAMIVNYNIIKSVEITEFKYKQQPDLVDSKKNIYFAYDVENIVKKMGGMITVSWLTRWFHTVTAGSYQSPNQIAVNFQKIEGSSYIEYNREGYVLDRVTPGITSFVIDQTIKASQVDAARVEINIREIIEKLRAATADWSYLPEKTPGNSSSDAGPGN